MQIAVTVTRWLLKTLLSMMGIASLLREADSATRTRTARVKGGRGEVSPSLVKMCSAFGGIGPVFPRGSRQERVLGNRRAAFRPIGLRTCPPDNMCLFPTQ